MFYAQICCKTQGFNTTPGTNKKPSIVLADCMDKKLQRKIALACKLFLMTPFFVLINLWTFQINLVIEKFFVTSTAVKKLANFNCTLGKICMISKNKHNSLLELDVWSTGVGWVKIDIQCCAKCRAFRNYWKVGVQNPMVSKYLFI